jgi:hypothetical protein
VVWTQKKVWKNTSCQNIEHDELEDGTGRDREHNGYKQLKVEIEKSQEGKK